MMKLLERCLRRIKSRHEEEVLMLGVQGFDPPPHHGPPVLFACVASALATNTLSYQEIGRDW
eukprot:1892671-Prorocentrum_lima.AAC.1